MIFANGFFENEQHDPSVPMDNPDGAAAALELAREGIVLLKMKASFFP